MNYRLSPELASFQNDVEQFLRDELPDSAQNDVLGKSEWASDEDFASGVQFCKRLGKRGWLTAHWPREFGGSDMPAMQQMVLQEQLAYHRAPMVNPNGLSMLAPILMIYGTEEQRKEHLPGIASCDVMWAQGYSEPNAGSDLASLQTRAVRDGDEYILNGEKVWTGMAHRADWLFVLARTDPDAPKHRGISFLMLDMKTPGITVQPLRSMAGMVTFNQEFFENVRIPAKNLVGEENRGWYVGTTLLNFERSNIGAAASTRRDLDDLIAYLREVGADGRSANCWGEIRAQVAELVIETEIGRQLCYRIGSLQEKGVIPSHEASASKLFNSQLAQRVAQAGYNIMGLAGQVRPESPRWAVLGGRFCMSVQMSLIGTIGGGTSEIQRNLIATRGLGLPRV